MFIRQKAIAKILVSMLLISAVFLGQGNLFANQTVHDQHLIGYWSFEGEGNIAKDFSGRHNDGRLVNMDINTCRQEGKNGKGLKLDGVDDYVELGDIFNALPSLTFSMWIYLERNKNVEKYVSIVDKFWDGNRRGWFLWLQKTADGRKPKFLVATDKNNNNSGCILSKQTLNYNIWYHLACTWNSSSSKVSIYINGKQKGSVDITGNITGVNRVPFRIGNRCYLSRNNSHFKGMIDEIGVWDRALSSKEIKDIYIAGGKTTIVPAQIKPHGKVVKEIETKNFSGAWYMLKTGTDEKKAKALGRVENAVSMSYDFSDISGPELYFVRGATKGVQSTDNIYMEIKGDGFMNRLFVILKDASGEEHLVWVKQITWRGWQNININLKQFLMSPPKGEIHAMHWGGDRNQVIDFPITAIDIGICKSGKAVKQNGEISLRHVKFTQ